MPDLATSTTFLTLRSGAYCYGLPASGGSCSPRTSMKPVFDEDPDTTTMDGLAQERYQRVWATGEPCPIVHRNIYRVHQRVATRYRVGRGALAGDAAHVNNPLGGMGLNGGIHDAVMLSGAIGRAFESNGDDTALDHYANERRRIAVQYIQAQTAQNEQNITPKQHGGSKAAPRRTETDGRRPSCLPELPAQNVDDRGPAKRPRLRVTVEGSGNVAVSAVFRPDRMIFSLPFFQKRDRLRPPVTNDHHAARIRSHTEKSGSVASVHDRLDVFIAKRVDQ